MSQRSLEKKTKGARPLGGIKYGLKREPSFRKTKFVGHKPEDKKISEVVMRFAEPYWPYVEMEDEWKNLVAIEFIA